jgi:hypothetical protein
MYRERVFHKQGNKNKVTQGSSSFEKRAVLGVVDLVVVPLPFYLIVFNMP